VPADDYQRLSPSLGLLSRRLKDAHLPSYAKLTSGGRSRHLRTDGKSVSQMSLKPSNFRWREHRN